MRPTLPGLAALAVGLLGCVEPPASTLLALNTCAISPEGALCDDNEPCTVNDQCIAGICVGVVAVDGTLCTDGDVCTFGDVCDKGRCVGTPAPDNFPCTDGDTCTMGDVCRASKCVAGPPLVCNDGMFCTMDRCVNGVGCQFTPVVDCTPPPEVPDAAPDTPVVDAPGEPIDSAIDAGEAGEAGDDGPLGGEALEAAEAPADAAEDAAPDVRPELAPEPPPDAPADPPPPVIDLRARGGACLCNTGDAGSDRANALLGVLLLAAAFARRNRRG